MEAKAKVIKKETEEFAQDVIEGLSQKQKTLPCKYFYDSKGSQLFEDICELDEYYITRTELSLLDSIKQELANMIGSQATIIEPGAGAGTKIQKLLSALDSPKSYVPIDISEDFLNYSKEKINQKFPLLEVQPIKADFTDKVHWDKRTTESNRTVFFPGSTIGNFSPTQASKLLSNLAQLADVDGAVIVGFDLKKSVDRIEAAYNDKKGVTAKFNKNILSRINRELEADIDLDSFQHEALFNHEESRIEMHLKSRKAQTIEIEKQRFEFDKEETIHTENSYKYSNQAFIELADKAGLKSEKHWMDKERLVSMHYLTQN
ncbi:L-histidine N(alpha)-methyltransferase [Aliikangiella sp. G2MR2-5]|uniref:L-histidine N(alpha)-methyltransferase n=1 Tax=Aliikangiella sp. G2MR2-5 TaxID=2788943 RepID=UPI0018A9B883|nr:L-histidine N(alpha)-methyltransferase [Aliikangiella sp. G2MR2-5]